MVDHGIPYGKVTRSSDLGAIVRAKRKALKLTQNEAAALCNVGNRFLSELERGKQSCELELTLRVLERLGIDLLARPRGAT